MPMSLRSRSTRQAEQPPAGQPSVPPNNPELQGEHNEPAETQGEPKQPEPSAQVKHGGAAKRVDGNEPVRGSSGQPNPTPPDQPVFAPTGQPANPEPEECLLPPYSEYTRGGLLGLQSMDSFTRIDPESGMRDFLTVIREAGRGPGEGKTREVKYNSKVLLQRLGLATADSYMGPCDTEGRKTELCTRDKDTFDLFVDVLDEQTAARDVLNSKRNQGTEI